MQPCRHQCAGNGCYCLLTELLLLLPWFFHLSSLLITLSDLSEYLKQQPALSPSNLFRKQYGNLEHVFSHEDFSNIFSIENSVVRLQSLQKLQRALEAGQLTQALYTRCGDMHTFKRRHDLSTLKTVSKNECKNCGETYAELVNVSQKMCNGAAHVPSFDWNIDDDVLKCQI